MKQVVAEIAKDNSRMLATFRNRGFEIRSPDGAGRGDGDEGVLGLAQAAGIPEAI